MTTHIIRKTLFLYRAPQPRRRMDLSKKAMEPDSLLRNADYEREYLRDEDNRSLWTPFAAHLMQIVELRLFELETGSSSLLRLWLTSGPMTRPP